ncbi:MAG: hypothetical protein JSS27_08070 [Planctomycetes bacterium]|nr:hypothetical protein [Planctomycetota bacterium]
MPHDGAAQQLGSQAALQLGSQHDPQPLLQQLERWNEHSERSQSRTGVPRQQLPHDDSQHDGAAQQLGSQAALQLGSQAAAQLGAAQQLGSQQLDWQQ